MSLYTFNRTGLLTKETTYLLKNLENDTNWGVAKQKLYSSGFIPSENRNEELFRELNTLRKLVCTEFKLEDKFPRLNELWEKLNPNYPFLIDRE